MRTDERLSIFLIPELAKPWRTSCEEGPGGKAGQEAEYFPLRFPFLVIWEIFASPWHK